MAPFRDRSDAGRRLAQRLLKHRGGDVVVLGLPRGGVPVAYEVAQALGAPLDVLVTRKLGVPWQPELGFGAVAPGGVRVLNPVLLADAGVTEQQVEEVAARETEEMERRVARYRAGRPPLDLRGRTVVLVDDGLATGYTARAAIEAARAQRPRRVILAVPVAPPDTLEELGREADEVVCLEAPARFQAIGAWYEDFRQVGDEDVLELLGRAAASAPRAPAVRREGSGSGASSGPVRRAVQIPAGTEVLDGELVIPEGAQGLVLFAHGSGSSRFSPRNQAVARTLREAGLATLLFDLLSPAEEAVDAEAAELRFDIPFLASRLADVTAWVRRQPETRALRIGYFGSSTGAAAALLAAAEDPGHVAAVVSRGGRPDLAKDALPGVRAPTLLIVGGEDTPVIAMNRSALQQLRVEKALEVVPGATHLFEEHGALERVAALASEWFVQHLGKPARPRAVRGR